MIGVGRGYVLSAIVLHTIANIVINIFIVNVVNLERKLRNEENESDGI